MQLKKTTNYAIRMIIEMAKRNKITCRESAEMLGVEESYASVILSKLNEAGVICAVQGINGGYSLKANVEHLTLYDVIRVMENTIKINRCLEEDEFCTRKASQICKVRRKYQTIQEMIEQELKSLTFQDFLDYEKRNGEVNIS